MKLFEFFAEENGQLSNMRLNATTLVFSGCFVVVYATIMKTLDGNIIAAATLLVTLGIGGKAVQKKDEGSPDATAK